MRPSSGPPQPRRKSDGPKTMNPVTMLRIVLVDNLVAYRQKMKGWITEIGTRADDVLEAGTSVEALEVIGHNEYNVDVVVCEWDDPDVNGLELVEQLRKNPETARIGFIAMAGNDPAAIRAAKGAGANEVVVKPVTAVEILKALSAVQRTLKPRSNDTRRRMQQAASMRQQSTKLSSTIANELRGSGKLGRYKAQGVIATGPYLNRLYWVESGSVFVRETRPDGTVIEYRATPGKFFGEAAFAGETIPELHAVSEVESIIGWQEKEAVQKTMQRLPILAHYFRTIVAEKYRNNVVVEMEEGAAGSLKGTLDSLNFPDLMQMMTGTKKTGLLRIESGGDTAVIHLAGGAVRHAELGQTSGEDVLYRCITWPGGRFQFSPQDTAASPKTIAAEINMLLMEGLRRRDVSSVKKT